MLRRLSPALLLGLACGPARVGSPPDAGGADAGCPALTGLTMEHHTDLTTDETWKGDGTVHHVSRDLTIRPGMTLTLEACARVELDAHVTLTVDGAAGKPGKLVARGAPGRPVHLTATVAEQPWTELRALVPFASMDFEQTTLEHGGQGALHGASLHLEGADAYGAAPSLGAKGLTIAASAGAGVLLENGAGFTADSTSLTVQGSGAGTSEAAVVMTPMAAGTLPPVSLVGNGADVVRLDAPSLQLPDDLTLENRGAPYHFAAGQVQVARLLTGPQTLPTLTVKPGVELRFDEALLIGSDDGGVLAPAKLLALGTAEAPITFTSAKATPAAGDWGGLWLHTGTGSKLAHVRLRYGGGYTGFSSANCKPIGTSDRAGLVIGPNTVPAAADFIDVAISDSLAHGIDAAWTSADFGPDLTAGFSFTRVSGCKQTNNGRFAGCGVDFGCLVP